MIPLIGILLCVYLVFKGVELFLIPYSNKDAPSSAIIIGIIAFFLSVGIATVFALLFLTAGASVPTFPTR